MCSVVSQLYSAVYAGLGMPEDQFLSKIELSNILFRQLSLRMESVRQSEQRVAVAKTSEFTLGNNENTKDLTALEDDFVIPLWVERQIVSVNSRPVWQFVPTVNLSQLQARRALAYPAVSFRGENSLEVIAEFSYYGGEIAQPSRIHRVWYSPTVPFPDAESSAITLPDNLTNMITLDCMVRAIPLMITNASKLVSDDASLSAQMEAWKLMLVEHKEERAEFQKYFDLWRKGSRGGHRSRRRKDVLRREPGSATNWLISVTQSGN